MDAPESQPALWRQDESLAKLTELLADIPDRIRVVSFDFFDTLVCRLCAEPSDLFVEVGRRLAERQMLAVPLSPSEFRAARIAADETARRNARRAGRSPEVQLADIYRELKAVVRNPAAARDLEVEVELSFCFLNPAMASLVNHVRTLGCKLAVLSDSYFTGSELSRLLRRNGFSPALFDAVIVSCERGKAKWDGQLYNDLFKRFDIHPSELLHIGDNPHADIQMALQYGVRTCHYYRTTPRLESVFRSEKDLRGPADDHAASLNSLRVLSARKASSDEDAFRDGAMVFGPVLSRYADWAVERFSAAGVRTVLALMREGEVLGELVRRAAAASGVELRVVTCYASRISTGIAAMPEAGPDQAAELLEGSGRLTPHAVLEILGLGAEASRFLDESTLAKPLAPSGLAGFLALLFKLPHLAQEVEAKRKERHALAFDYLASLVGEETTVGVLDLGWSGSIQRNIARILRAGGRNLRTIGCYLACTRRAGRLSLEGDSAHGYLGQEWSRSGILPEIAITACVGSTDSYVREASGNVVPVIGPFSTTPDQVQTKQRLRDGILSFQSLWLSLRSSEGPSRFTPEMLADVDAQSASILCRLLEFPTKPEADRLGGLHHDENYFGRNYSAPLCAEEAPLRLRREGIRSLFQAADCYWPQGVAARANPRLVTMLRSRWEDPSALGRLGAWSTAAINDSGITDEELASLGPLLKDLAAEQTIFCGVACPPVEALFASLWQQPASGQNPTPGKPRLILSQPRDGSKLRPEFRTQCALISGDPGSARNIRAMRSQLSPSARIALILAHDLSDSSVSALLLGLAPFLGKHGVILAPFGCFDRHAPVSESRFARRLHDWFEAVGRDAGYRFISTSPAPVPHVNNWIILQRTPEQVAWHSRSMHSIEDLAYGFEEPAHRQPQVSPAERT